MEEKDIKELWKKGDELVSENYSQETIDKVIQSKPKDIVSKFIKTLKVEFWLNLVSLGVLTIFLIYGQHWLAAIGVTTLNLLLFFYYKDIIRKLMNESIDTDVAQYLCRVYRSIKRFILHYKILLWVITVPAYAIGIYFYNPKKFSNMDSFMTLKAILILVVGLVVAIVFAHSILYFMYGKKGKKIKQMVDLLRREEDN